MRRSALLVTMLATFAIGLVGCSSETPGDATPGDAPGTGGLPSFSEDPPTNVEPTESGEDPGAGTADLRPCEVLSAQDLSALDLPADGAEDDIGSSRTCQWQTSGSHTVTVGIFDDLGIDGVVSSGTTEEKTVGSRQAVQYTVGSGTCALALGVTDSSRVDVSAAAGGDMDAACEVANQAAELVEPKLP